MYFSYSEDTEKYHTSPKIWINRIYKWKKTRNLWNIDPKIMLNKKLLSNSPKKITDVHKPSEEFEDESEQNYEVRKRNSSSSKKKENP